MPEVNKSPSLALPSPAQTFIRDLFALLKMRQTVLLLVTGVSAYALTLPGAINWGELALGTLALFAAIGGCTVLNMVFDSDIDAKMKRTTARPLPAGRLSRQVAVAFGLALSLPGLLLAWWLQPLFGLLITVGYALDFGVYTLWLKRRTPFSILWGGLSGGMPALAGRALALGYVDAVGLLLALAVLLWIPSHILSLSMRHASEYARAGVPVWPNRFGFPSTYRLIAAATVANVVTLIVAGTLLSTTPWAMGALAALGAALVSLALVSLFRPSQKNNWRLFKFASAYMLISFTLLTLGTVLR